jgi:hypothetical protein
MLSDDDDDGGALGVFVCAQQQQLTLASRRPGGFRLNHLARPPASCIKRSERACAQCLAELVVVVASVTR